MDTIDLSGQDLEQSEVEFKLRQILLENKGITNINLSGNKLMSIEFLSKFVEQGALPQLKILNISQNMIQFMSIHNISGLITLDVSSNPISEFQLHHLPALKSIDARDCNINDVAFMQLLEQPTKPRHIRLAGNKVTDIGVNQVVRNPALLPVLNEFLTTLDLKQNQTQYQTLLQVKALLPVNRKPSSSVTKLPALNNSRANSRNPSAKNAQMDTKDLVKLMNSLQQEFNLNWPQALAATMLGRDHLLVQQAKDMDEGRCKSKICSCLVIGIKCQTDLEEQACQGFARKVGTVFCKHFKSGNNVDCKGRAEATLQVIQKRIEKQTEASQDKQ
ncbi:Conserved_hypothetical protein [Hexamita inflata]|uniref:Uncharacterized protein n=1 Tax=Hexamita inflata TaxID=28002 RepID=A0AA86NIE3_9EUKA|nr:Conserved hypothetical protein [Hexamita inflata]